MIDRHDNLSHVMCHDCLIGSQMFDGSCVHSRGHVRVHVVSCDTIECGVMWNSIQLYSYGIHVHTGLMFALSPGFT